MHDIVKSHGNLKRGVNLVYENFKKLLRGSGDPIMAKNLTVMQGLK